MFSFLGASYCNIKLNKLVFIRQSIDVARHSMLFKINARGTWGTRGQDMVPQGDTGPGMGQRYWKEERTKRKN